MSFLQPGPAQLTPNKNEIVNVRLPEGSTRRIDAVLRGGEIRAAFIRVAVENELRRREKRLK
jgi:metal-responsive CopG/Arc/MetJ family transcriptional regulator